MQPIVYLITIQYELLPDEENFLKPSRKVNLPFLTTQGIKRKEFKFPAIIPIVTYNGMERWHVPKHFKEKIKNYELFGSNIYRTIEELKVQALRKLHVH